ncbi:MAG: deoxyribonuclease [Candidatus Thiodiazotropha sp.]
MTASEPRLPDDFSSVEEISRDSGRLRVTLEILVALLVLVGIYYFLAPEGETDLPPLQRQEIDPIIRARIDSPQGDQAAVEQSANAPEVSSAEEGSAESSATPPLADGEAARRIIAAQRGANDKRPLPEINRLAKKYQGQGQVTDAYLLWFYAARQGDGQAAFALASLHDPNHFKPGNGLLTAADVTQAVKWYRVATQQSVPQANERLRALRALLQAQADEGDMAARRLLLNWQ